MLDPSTHHEPAAAPVWRPAMLQVRNIGTNRGKPRLWIEGEILEAASLTRGRLYTIEATADGFDLIPSARGERRVSGKTKNERDVPVIDIATSALLLPLVARGGRVDIAYDGARPGLAVRLVTGVVTQFEFVTSVLVLVCILGVSLTPRRVHRMLRSARDASNRTTTPVSEQRLGMSSLLSYSFLLGPIALYVIGVLCRVSQNHSPGVRRDNFFFATELTISGLGSILGTLVSLPRPIDETKSLNLVVLSVVGVFVLLMVNALHRSFEAPAERPKLQVAVLGVLANLTGAGLLGAALFVAKP